MIAGFGRPSPVDALGASCEATDGEDNQLPTSVVNDLAALAWPSHQEGLRWERMRSRSASSSHALLITCTTSLPPRCRRRTEKGPD
jgi:hypothetical protein